MIKIFNQFIEKVFKKKKKKIGTECGVTVVFIYARLKCGV